MSARKNYVNNGAGLVAGFLARLDAASGLTNKQIRMTQMGVVIQTLLNRANKYIGQSSLDGLTLVSMQTQLTQDLEDLSY